MLPVVVPLAAAMFVALLWHLHRRDRLSAPRAIVSFLLCVYAAGVVANTVFPIFWDMPGGAEPWTAYLDVVPLVGYELSDAVTNVLVFVPLGMLVSLCVDSTSWWRVLAVAATLSLAIELAQLFTARVLGGGHIADVNDLIFNVAGAALGLGLISLLSRVPGAALLISRFRWR
ncbi:VanZ family protein [Solirubrobacter phytolaccae]|uniref:VanZ family protein n=1 Tax=Solirubrobacter phytolaccae TaxID=1404360 RepID=A0A9X3NMV0_9ACTN|nr:VanZ family protein [Solirubrobacter phytolaccae]MDA0184347.1 VanZ family protein [Solirubrobacter phytolaccae]